MNLLIVDTSAGTNWVALFSEMQLMSSVSYLDQRSSLVNLIPAIDMVLNNTQKKLPDIDCIAVVIGPGSWASLRIGLATVKQLCIINKIPLFTVNNFDLTLRAYRQQADESDEKLIVMMSAGRDKSYLCTYQRENETYVQASDYLAEEHETLLHKLDKSAKIVGDTSNWDDEMRESLNYVDLIPQVDSRYLHIIAQMVNEADSIDYDMAAILPLKPLYVLASSAEINFGLSVT